MNIKKITIIFWVSILGLSMSSVSFAQSSELILEKDVKPHRGKDKKWRFEVDGYSSLKPQK